MVAEVVLPVVTCNTFLHVIDDKEKAQAIQPRRRKSCGDGVEATGTNLYGLLAVSLLGPGNDRPQKELVTWTSRWHPVLGQHPEDPVWLSATTLIIKNLPARCRLQELVSFIKDIVVADESLRIFLPFQSQKGKNKGYSLVSSTRCLQPLAASLWSKTLRGRHIKIEACTEPIKSDTTAVYRLGD
ncbi:unnamed protein product [Symbiodinium natans]|uniref:RRM domain-containing protein n=1 Tax=Symbiodinium natans TaxID=878477 RepID=A0A812GB49_9DINO|nr:unnamed protein product [Symbiodinium natans]